MLIDHVLLFITNKSIKHQGVLIDTSCCYEERLEWQGMTCQIFPSLAPN